MPCPRKWMEGGAESGRKGVKGGVRFQQREILTLTLATREKKQLSQHSLTWRSENQDRQTGRQSGPSLPSAHSGAAGVWLPFRDPPCADQLTEDSRDTRQHLGGLITVAGIPSVQAVHPRGEERTFTPERLPVGCCNSD